MPFGYTGRDFDSETGLSYYRARYYDGSVGRFLSEDPIGFGGGDANLYRYVSNSPANYTDPSGRIAIAPILIGAGLLPIVFDALWSPVQTPVACGDIDPGLPWYYRVPLEVAIGAGVGAVASGSIDDLAGVVGRGISGSGGLGSFDDWLATGAQGGFRRNIGAWRTNNFRNNSTRFYHGTSISNASSIRSSGLSLSYGRANADFGAGVYLSRQRSTALWSPRRNFSPDNIDVVTFRVSNYRLSMLDDLTFDSTSEHWADFVRFHKVNSPVDLMHGGQAYDSVTGPLFQRFTRSGDIIAWENMEQTSIHTQRAVDLFNQSMRR